jgi:elongation factor P--(R)-beta-lysine ligase
VSILAQANTSHASKLINLKKRARLLQKARAFFHERSVLEVDVPCLSKVASVDAHIDLITCEVMQGQAFLHSSPEYGMKRLLAEGAGDIYQLSHVFRDGECGRKHNPEFMMCEWYRVGMSFEAMMQETCDFISLFVSDLPRQIISYQEAFIQHTGLDPFKASIALLEQFIQSMGHNVAFDPEKDTKDDRLSYILSAFVEPYLGSECLTILPYFPPTQAALAQVRTVNNNLVAERFEVFCDGLELANGYHELQDAHEQRKRLHEANQMRLSLGKKSLPIDEHFLQALEAGLPDSCGVAVGFDRLMMLHCKTDQLSDVLSWDWSLA